MSSSKSKAANRFNLRAVQKDGHIAGLAVRREHAARRIADLAPIITQLWQGGAASYGSIARALNERGILAARGGTWTTQQVKRVLDRLSGPS